MSLYLLLLSFVISFGYNNENSQTPEESTREVTVESKKEQQEMLIGKITKEDLTQSPYAGWFERGYNSFKPAPASMQIIKNNLAGYQIVVLMGTWCPDSRREVPQLLKILDEANFDMSKLTMIGVDRNKTTPDNLEKQWNLNRVPTFIFLKDGKEVNRYVEYARESIEKDIASILASKDYKHSYAE